MNPIKILYTYFYYKIYYLYKKYITEKEADTYANLAFSCFLLYTVIFIQEFIEKNTTLLFIPLQSIKLVVMIEGLLLFGFNYYLLNYKDKYIPIITYFERVEKRILFYVGYLILLLLIILLIYFGITV